MSAEAIATLIASGVALVTSIATLLISFYVQARREVKRKRVFPIVSILDNAEDKVNERFRNTGCRIFFDKKEKEDLSKNSYYYFVVRNENKNFHITNCTVKIEFEGNQTQTKTYRVGTIIYGTMVVIPVRIHRDDRHFQLQVEYTSESGEGFEYIVESDRNFTYRKDYYAIWNRLRKKYSKRIEMNHGLTLSYRTEDFYENDDFSFELKNNGTN